MAAYQTLSCKAVVEALPSMENGYKYRVLFDSGRVEWLEARCFDPSQRAEIEVGTLGTVTYRSTGSYGHFVFSKDSL